MNKTFILSEEGCRVKNTQVRVDVQDNKVWLNVMEYREGLDYNRQPYSGWSDMGIKATISIGIGNKVTADINCSSHGASSINDMELYIQRYNLMKSLVSGRLEEFANREYVPY